VVSSSYCIVFLLLLFYVYFRTVLRVRYFIGRVNNIINVREASTVGGVTLIFEEIVLPFDDVNPLNIQGSHHRLNATEDGEEVGVELEILSEEALSFNHILLCGQDELPHYGDHEEGAYCLCLLPDSGRDLKLS